MKTKTRTMPEIVIPKGYEIDEMDTVSKCQNCMKKQKSKTISSTKKQILNATKCTKKQISVMEK